MLYKYETHSHTSETSRCSRISGADLGIAITGEAGPNPAEDHPVGTVFVALADGRRTWVKRLDLGGEGRDRNAIRRLAALHTLDLVRRYRKDCMLTLSLENPKDGASCLAELLLEHATDVNIFFGTSVNTSNMTQDISFQSL